MLTKDEQLFIEYWSQHRLKKKKIFGQLYLGFPLAVFIVAALFLNFLSGWYKRAEMELRTNNSLIITVLIAGVIIAVFVTILSIKLKWDRNEQYYIELLKKSKNKNQE